MLHSACIDRPGYRLGLPDFFQYESMAWMKNMRGLHYFDVLKKSKHLLRAGKKKYVIIKY